MEPDEEAKKRALPALGYIMTVTYSADEMRPRRTGRAEKSGDDGDSAQDRLHVAQGLSTITTWMIDVKTGRTYRKE